MSNVIKFEPITVDTEAFEKENNLDVDDTFFHNDVQKGTFTISDDTEYGYNLDIGLSIFKTSSVETNQDEHL